MAITARVRCINKSDRYDPHERITHIGGVNPGGERWRLTQREGIEGVQNGKYSFYVEERGHRVRVVVAKSQYGHLYLKTEADGEQPDNLLSLPECPR